LRAAKKPSTKPDHTATSKPAAQVSTLLVHALSDVIYGLLQQHERMDRIAQSMMIKVPLSLEAI